MEAFTNFEKAPDLTKRGYRLDRMEKLLTFFGNPHLKMNVIHIAGSKGKGSTAAFTESILREAGYVTGMYSSPHISDYRERIKVNGDFASESVYLKNMNKIKNLIEGEEYLSLPGGSEPTTFELLTLLAFLVFFESNCQWIVLETGLGGRLDATNLVNPALVLLTPIELEHTDLLGNSIEKIAFEKAGIIKSNVPVFSSYQNQEALQVFKTRAEEMKAPFYYLPDLIENIKSETVLASSTLIINWCSGRKNKTELHMIGMHQAENCALAIAGLTLLFPEFKDELFDKAVTHAFIPGRMEILGSSPYFMIDGAHTKRSVSMALKTFKEIFKQKGILIFGSVEGKNTKAMAEILGREFQNIIISRPGTFKKSNPEKVFSILSQFKANCFLLEDPMEAEKKARNLSKGKIPILVTGSFYMAAEIRKIINTKGNRND